MAAEVLTVNDLPDETLVAVFMNLQPEVLLAVELVCQRWREVASMHSQVLWKPFFDRSPFSRWWLPYEPSTSFAALKEKREGQRQQRIDYKWEYLTKNKSTERWIKFASFRRVRQGLRDHSEDYGGVVKWSRNERTSGALGPNRLALRALLVGGGNVGCHTLTAALGRLFPGVCISLDSSMDVLMNPLSQIQLIITREEEVEAKALLEYKREVAGTPFIFGDLPLEVEFEVADIFAVEGRSELIRAEMNENVRPTIVLAAFSLEDSRSLKKLREQVIPAVRARFNDLPILLVGTKLDTRESQFSFIDDSKLSTVWVNSASPTHEQGLELCYEVGAKNYVECSLLTREGLPLLVRETAELGVRHTLQFFSRADLETRPKNLMWNGDEDSQVQVHDNIQCNGCGVAPVVGNCYRCVSCPDYHLCQSCVEHSSDIHPPSHSFKPFHHKKRSTPKRHVHKSTSFHEGFRHRSSFIEGDRPSTESSPAPSSSGDEQEATESLRQQKEEIRKKGTESFQRTGLGESWKESVEDVFRMFSKSPDSQTSKRKREDPPGAAVRSSGTHVTRLAMPEAKDEAAAGQESSDPRAKRPKHAKESQHTPETDPQP